MISQDQKEKERSGERDDGKWWVVDDGWWEKWDGWWWDGWWFYLSHNLPSHLLPSLIWSLREVANYREGEIEEMVDLFEEKGEKREKERDGIDDWWWYFNHLTSHLIYYLISI